MPSCAAAIIFDTLRSAASVLTARAEPGLRPRLELVGADGDQRELGGHEEGVAQQQGDQDEQGDDVAHAVTSSPAAGSGTPLGAHPGHPPSVQRLDGEAGAGHLTWSPTSGSRCSRSVRKPARVS